MIRKWFNFRDAFNFVVIAVLMFGLSFLLIEGWDAQHKIDLQQDEQRMEQMLGYGGYEYGRRMPDPPTGARPNYGDQSTPKTKVFQDASRQSTSGMGYAARRAERGR